MVQKGFGRLKAACYTANITMSIVGNISPILFLTFRTLYGVSFSLLGTLVLINFVTQLSVDLVFSFFSHKFNISKTVKLMPVLGMVGIVTFALAPLIFPNAVYLGLALGTVLFSASSGLAEVLISPVIAAIPAENPDHEMSKLHSVYAWGVVGVVLVATAFLLLFKAENWQWLVGALAVVPLTSAVLFFGAEIPKMQTPERTAGAMQFLKNKGVWLCVIAIFLGGASEVTMAQWCSGYLEGALGIPKAWGDIFGVALFSAALGLGRSLYAKIGKNVEKVLFFSAIGATVCYLVAAFSPIPVLGLIACALTGFCTAMLWPGCLIVASDRFPSGGVLIYALMAAGGDFGASVGPQLMGLVTDAVMVSPTFLSLAETLGLTAEAIGMKAGLLVGAAFPLLGVLVFGIVLKRKRREGVSLDNALEK